VGFACAGFVITHRDPPPIVIQNNIESLASWIRLKAPLSANGIRDNPYFEGFSTSLTRTFRSRGIVHGYCTLDSQSRAWIEVLPAMLTGQSV
jgi:hypothetical protein